MKTKDLTVANWALRAVTAAYDLELKLSGNPLLAHRKVEALQAQLWEDLTENGGFSPPEAEEIGSYVEVGYIAHRGFGRFFADEFGQE
jgi:hypothetical protein